MLRPLLGNQLLLGTIACAALVFLVGCDSGKKLTVGNLTIARESGPEDATKVDAVLNFTTLEVFELSLTATGSGFPAGESICEIQFFKPNNQPAFQPTRCNLIREGKDIKIYQRLLSPEEPTEGELRISHNGQRILTRKVKVTKKQEG
jgi:hypothetical protein